MVALFTYLMTESVPWLPVGLLTFCEMTAKCHILMEVWTQRSCDPEIQTWPRFLYSSSIIKYHCPLFDHSEVIVLTNTQTNPQTNRCLWKQPLISLCFVDGETGAFRAVFITER